MFITTYSKEFEWPKSTGWGVKKWPKDRNLETEEIKRRDPVYKNNETLSDLSKECLTPFNYLLQPKPIIQTDPRQPFSKPELPKDDGSARLTRPRVYKCPEISLDDIDDPEIRDKIIDFTYSTTWGLASKDAASKVLKREISNCVWEPPDHILLAKKSEGGKNEECEFPTDEKLNDWDRQQAKGHGDPTLAFWRQFRNETALKVSDPTVANEISPEFTNKILSLAKERKLRLPYNLKPIDYGGFMPACPMNIEPQKKQLELSDPMMTTYQIASRWWDQ